MTETQFLAHVGPLGHHDMWVIVPMVVLSVIVMVVMARPKRPPPDDRGAEEGAGTVPTER